MYNRSSLPMDESSVLWKFARMKQRRGSLQWRLDLTSSARDWCRERAIKVRFWPNDYREPFDIPTTAGVEIGPTAGADVVFWMEWK